MFPAEPSARRRGSSASSSGIRAASIRYFASVYSGGGFTLGAGYRHFYGDRTLADVKGLYSVKNYKLLELSTDSWGHANGRLESPRTRRLARRHAGRVLRHRQRQSRGQQQLPDEAGATLPATRTPGPCRGWCSGAGMSYEDFNARERDRRKPVDRGGAHPRISARARRQPHLPPLDDIRRHRLRARRPATRAAAGSTKSPTITTPTATTPTASIASMPRSCSTSRSCARTGSSRCTGSCNRRSTTRTPCPISCCRRSAAAARCAATAVGGSAICTACCCRASSAGSRTASGSTWRCSTTPARSRPISDDFSWSGLASDVGRRRPVPRPALHAAADRACQRPRGNAAGVCRQRGILIAGQHHEGSDEAPHLRHPRLERHRRGPGHGVRVAVRERAEVL